MTLIIGTDLVWETSSVPEMVRLRLGGAPAVARAYGLAARPTTGLLRRPSSAAAPR